MPYDLEELLKLGRKRYFITPEANAALNSEEEPAPVKAPAKPTVNPLGGVGGSKQSGFNLPQDPQQAATEHLRAQENAKRQVLDEELFGVETARDPGEVEYRRATGGIYDPTIERRLSSEQRGPLRSELEAQQHMFMGEIAAGKGRQYTKEAGAGLRKVEDLLRRLEGRPLDSDEQLSKAMEIMPQWEARAREVGTSGAMEELRAAGANQQVHPAVAQDIAHRLAIAGKIYSKDPSHPEALPLTMTDAARVRTNKFMEEQQAEAQKQELDAAVQRASQPDMLQQLFQSLIGPSGPEADPTYQK